jgi:hypothetical protein
MTPTPELEKMKAVKEKSQAIGEFIEWMQQTKGLGFGRYSSILGQYLPAHFNMEKTLAEFFEIDLKKAEAEKLAILLELQEMNK